MTVEVKEGQDIQKVVQMLIEHHGHEKSELIPILQEINSKFGYISDDAITEISERMNIPSSHIYSVATFYRMLSTERHGQHVIRDCPDRFGYHLYAGGVCQTGCRPPAQRDWLVSGRDRVLPTGADVISGDARFPPRSEFRFLCGSVG